MTDGNITFPGGYTLLGMYLTPLDNSENKLALNIAPLVPSFNIIESLDFESIRGSATVIDYTGTLEDYPIRGEERLMLEVEDAMKVKRIYDLFVYKVDNVKVTDTNDGLTYTIHYTSYQRFLSEKRKIIAPFAMPVSEIVKRIFETDFMTFVPTTPPEFSRNPGELVEDQTNKKIIIEDTEGVLECVIPNYTPTQAMKFLASRSYSTSSPSCSFRFFESADSFYFVSDEFLFADAFKRKKVYSFSFAEGIGNTAENFYNHMNNFTKLTNSNRFDTFDDIHGGTYRSRVLVLDIINRSVNLRDEGYSYPESRDTYFNTQDGQKVIDRHSDNFIEDTFTPENAKQFLVVKDYMEQNNGQLKGDQYFPTIVTNKLAYRKHLNSITVEAEGYGRLDITCGDVVYMTVPEFTTSRDKSENKQLSGHYIVKTVTKDFNMDTSTNYYTLVKRDWSVKEDTKVDHFLSTGLGGL
jgi:hypothetical protein